MKKKVLLTGASGLFGANAVFEGSQRFEILGTYLNHPIKFPCAQAKKTDLRNRSEVANLIQDFRPDVVIHTAADSNIDFCETHHELADDLNVNLTKQLAQEVTKAGKLFVYFSSDAFFDMPGGKSSENDLLKPVNYYGATKKRAEEEIRLLTDKHIIVRTNFYGWNAQNKLSLSEWILKNILEKNPINLFDDVEFTPLVANDLAKILFDVIETGFIGTLHIAGGEPVSKWEFGQRLCGAFGLDTSFIRKSSVENGNLTAPRSNGMALCTDKLSKLLPNTDLTLDRGLYEYKRLFQSGFPKRLKEAMGSDLGFLTLLQ